jgi:hypothetical protein
MSSSCLRGSARTLLPRTWRYLTAARRYRSAAIPGHAPLTQRVTGIAPRSRRTASDSAQLRRMPDVDGGRRTGGARTRAHPWTRASVDAHGPVLISIESSLWLGFVIVQHGMANRSPPRLAPERSRGFQGTGIPRCLLALECTIKHFAALRSSRGAIASLDVCKLQYCVIGIRVATYPLCVRQPRTSQLFGKNRWPW